MALSIDCFSTPAPPSAFRDLWPTADANGAMDENCAVPDVRALKQRMEARLGAVDALVAAAEAAAEPAPSSALVELQERWAAALRCDDATPSVRLSAVHLRTGDIRLLEDIYTNRKVPSIAQLAAALTQTWQRAPPAPPSVERVVYLATDAEDAQQMAARAATSA